MRFPTPRTSAKSRWVVMETISTLLQAAPSLGFTWGLLGGTSGVPRLPHPRDKSHWLLLHAHTREEFLLAVVLFVEMENKQLSLTFINNNLQEPGLSRHVAPCSGIRCATPCAGAGARVLCTGGSCGAST